MVEIPRGLEQQESSSPLQSFLTGRNLDSSAPISGEIARAIESGEISTEDGLAIYNEYTAQLEAESTTDHLTELLNRRGYEKRMASAFESLYAPENNRAVSPVAILVLRIDVDGLHLINENGHPTGDEALKAVAEAIRVNTRDRDVAGRVGGDEFAVGIVLESADVDGDFSGPAEAITQRFEEYLLEKIPSVTVIKDGQEILVKVSATVGHAIATRKSPSTWQEVDTAADANAVAKKEMLKQAGQMTG